MIMLIYSILLVTMHYVVLNGSRLVVKMVYQPFGPKMCQELCEDVSFISFIYKTNDLSCRVLSCTIQNRDVNNSRKCVKVDEMRNDSTSLSIPSKQQSLDAYLKGDAASFVIPPSATNSFSGNASDSHNENLHKACEDGNVCMVQYILSKGVADINSRGEMGWTPVMVAAGSGSVDVFHFLVSRNCDLMVADVKNNTLLHAACMGGSVDIVTQLIITEQFDIDGRAFQGRTPVMTAAGEGDIKVFNLLMSKGCNLTLVDDIKNNVLHYSCLGGHVDMVKHVLSKGIFDIDSRGFLMRTPVMIAAMMGHTEVVKLLVITGCNLKLVMVNMDTVLHDACFGGNVDMVRYILSNGTFDTDSRGFLGRTPIMIAARKGYIDVFQLLESLGCNQTLVDDRNNNVLHVSCYGGHVDMVRYVLSKGIFDIDSRRFLGRTSIMIAARKGYIDVYKLLESWGSNQELVDDENNNVLHIACSGGHVDMVRYILSNGIFDIDSRGSSGKTPVLVAAENGHINVFKLLVSEGCNQKLANDIKNNLLHLACFGGNVDMVRYILSKGILDIDSRGFLGRTPIMIAARKGYIDVFKLLESWGCNQKLVDDKNNNVLHIACFGGHVDMVRYILSNGIFDIDSRSSSGKTPVLVAAENGHINVFKLLVSEGCDLKLVNEINENVLHVACVGGCVDMVSYILSTGIFDIDSRGFVGSTPVMIAARIGHIELFKRLESEGCDLKLVNFRNNNVLHMACYGGHVKMVRYILSKGIFDIYGRDFSGRTPVMIAEHNRNRALLKLFREKSLRRQSLSRSR